MANHMKEVANMLGVELGERFNIKGVDDRCHYYLTENGLYCEETKGSKFHQREDENLFVGVILTTLLNGVHTIVRKPWKPLKDDEYYFIGADGNIWRGIWYGFGSEMVYYKLGNCYRSAEEAEADRDKWITFYASDEVLEV